MYYTGYPSDLNQRMKLHQEVKASSNKRRGPLTVIYFEVYLSN